MALIFADSMDHQPMSPATGSTATIQERKYTLNQNESGNSFSTGTSSYAYRQDRPGGGGWTLLTGTFTNGRRVFKTLPANYVTLVVGFWVLFTGSPASTNTCIMAMQDNGGDQMRLQGDGLGHITMTRNGTVLATSTNTVSTNTWYHFEMKSKIDPATGTYELRVNGSSVNWIPAATGQNTRSTANSYSNTIAFGATGTGQMYYNSLYVLDTSGAYANDFIGVSKVTALRPMAAGNYAQWSPTAGSNFHVAGKLIANDDATVNMSGTVNQMDTFLMGDLPYSGSVFAVQHVLSVRGTGSHSRSISAVQRSGGTDYVSSTQQFLPGAWAQLLDPISVDPSTAVQFTEATINAAEFGYKLIA